MAERQTAPAWEELVREQREFQNELFPTSSAASCAAHLAEEVQEVLAEPGNLKEWADCLLLVLGGAQRAAPSDEDFRAAVWAKMQECRGRTWALVEGGYHKHVDLPGDPGKSS
jgi:hypothetical protein